MIAAFCIWKAINRDLNLLKISEADLRNRIVDAKLQKDGKDPSFYEWKKEHGLRYYDPNNFDSLHVSNITASPFFHELLYPIAEFPQRTIKILWLQSQYLFLFIMTFLSMYLSKGMLNRLVILTFSIAFLFTEAWKSLTVTGQLYLFISFLFFHFFYFFRKFKQLPYAFVCGVICIMLILIRPNVVFAFLPFLIIAGMFSVRTKLVFLLPVAGFLLFIAGNSSERYLWQTYFNSVKQYVRFHSGQAMVFEEETKSPGYNEWGGLNMRAMDKAIKQYSHLNYSENGFFFVLIDNVFHKRHSTAFLFWSSFFLIVVALAIFWWYTKNWGNIPIINISIFGYYLYMILDLFSPVYRHQYYTVQRLMPLLVSGIIFSSKKWLSYTLIFAGLVLNIINIPAIPIEHTMGEYIWLVAFLLLSFTFSESGMGNKKLRVA
ncbi:MAG: hypothetical protein BGP13_17545 [Sphingobacteriales bacterium 40-81]|nr:MAG: hypothetical protein BGP13_17545 [Sphingobacteriales bacterium 40-81]